MNLRAYLRGIGAGLIVAAAVFLVASLPIKERQTESVDKSTLQSMQEETSVEESVSDEDKETETSVSKETESLSVSKEETSVSPAETTSETSEDDSPASVKTSVSVSSVEPETVEATPIDPLPEGDEGYETEGEFVSLKVVHGDSSVSVSRRLYEAGLVESAVEFDEYLCANNYDKYISVGEYEIPLGADFETIAKIISGR